MKLIYKDIIEEISKKKRFDIKLNLNRINNFLEKIDNPQNDFKSIHVAGSNGKGSTSNFIYSTLIEANYKTGLFQSPYITDYSESIQINNKKITKEEVIEYYEIIKKSNIDLTYFEIKTAMAFMHFKKHKVDYAIIEVGLGGKLDATNVINPILTIITNISLEHTNILGNSIKEIAKEKAGIIKKNVPLFTMVKGEALKVIKKIVKEKKSSINIVNYNKNLELKTKMKGKFQQYNAQLAYYCLKFLNINEKTIVKGIKKTYVKGRFEIKKNIIYDCAHNLDAFKKLREEIKLLKNKKKVRCIISIMEDKNINKMIKEIEKEIDFFIFTKVNNERSVNPIELSKHTKRNFIILNKPKEALNYAKNTFKKDLILITGSCYLVGEIFTQE